MWNTIRRWRTWIVNLLAAVLLVLPEILQAFAGFNWGEIVPPRYLPFVTLGLVVVNILMRPRAAVLPHEAEDK